MTSLTAPFRHRAFTQTWVGQFISIVGDAVYFVAIALFLLPRRDAAHALGLALGLASVGGLASLVVGGVLADRHRRTRMIVASDLIRASALIVLLVLGPQCPLLWLALCAMILGVGTGLYKPAYAALVPSLVPTEQRASANGLHSLTNRFASIVGALIAGSISAAFGASACLLLDVGSFLVSTLTLLGVRDAAPTIRDSQKSIWVEAAAGLRYVRQRPWMAAVMAQGTVQVAFVISPIAITLPLLIGRDSGWYGAVVAAEAAGAFTGASFSVRLRPRRRGLVALLVLLMQAPQTIAVALHAPVAVIAASSFATGVGLATFAVLWTTTLQLKVPQSHLGRVFSIDALTANGLNPLGLVVAGWLVADLGVSSVAWAALGILLLSILVPLAIPGVTTLGLCE